MFFQYWVMARCTKGGQEETSSNHAFEKNACEQADSLVANCGYIEAWVEDRLRNLIIYKVERVLKRTKFE